jgi:ketosteroid isomerase-like protein
MGNHSLEEKTLKTTDELVRELADREAIRELTMRYCDYVYRDDLEGVVSLFTDDGAFIVKGPGNEVVTRGRADLTEMYGKLFREVRPRPVIHSHVVELHGAKSASGRCYVELRSAQLEMERVGSGCWEDEYIKVGQLWKFASRRLVETDLTTPLRTFLVN